MPNNSPMRFRTEIEPTPFERKIGYRSRLLAIGSCFADNMAGALQHAKFNVTANPAGVLFNPESIAGTLRLFASGAGIRPEELTESGGRWFDYRFHGSLSASSPEEAAAKMNAAAAAGREALAACDTVIITFGTAWVYVLNSTGETVANCHRQPSALFTRRRMTVAEIVDGFSRLLETVLEGKHVIFTVSPVRHTGDGADQNFLSKATLKLAVAELVERYGNADYFPAYEILNDDLRDYRFYADDLVHPSAQAVAYIREKFFDAALDNDAVANLPQVEKIAAAAAHRPFNPDSEEYRAFCRNALAQIAELERRIDGIDFSAERAYFASAAQ